MAKLIDLSGKRFGNLTVTKLSHRRTQTCGASIVYWEVKCDCGKVFTRKTHYLKSPKYKNKSCGCAIPKLTGDRFRTHGMKLHPLYDTWRDMIRRCTNPKSKDWGLYGGRGITVCERWMNIENFIEDMGQRPEKHFSLDRIDNNKGYNKENCRWATSRIQANNKRSNRIFDINGERITLTQLAKRYEVNIATLHQRISLGESPIEAVKQKNRRMNRWVK